MALFGDFFGDFSAAALPQLGGKQFVHLTPIAIANQGASCRVAEAKKSEAVVEAHHPRRPNEIITNKLTIWGLLNDYRGTLVRIDGHWRIKELIATPTKVIV